ncbi:MAG: crossover junction endodeoxyribonuclease RuvC [Candidatus Kerfeldbacteria bacterium]|nr:crossover junction endodeoxyribonuclease RuvC [Candidatus Kerfeldbacteria bacterium]
MKPNTRRVCGIDPGLARLGWAIIEVTGQHIELVAADCLETASNQPAEQRLHELYSKLLVILQQYQPTVIGIEKLYFTNNVSTGIAVGQARGMVLLAAASTHTTIAEYTPTAVKQAVTGDGRADKRQIQHMVSLLLHLKQLPKHDDTTDAIAIALCASTHRLPTL